MPEYVRVRCEDTGHVSSIPESAAAHGNYTVLDEDAVSPVTGDVLPPVYADHACADSECCVESDEDDDQVEDPDEDDFLDD